MEILGTIILSHQLVWSLGRWSSSDLAFETLDGYTGCVKNQFNNSRGDSPHQNEQKTSYQHKPKMLVKQPFYYFLNKHIYLK